MAVSVLDMVSTHHGLKLQLCGCSSGITAHARVRPPLPQEEGVGGAVAVAGAQQHLRRRAGRDGGRGPLAERQHVGGLRLRTQHVWVRECAAGEDGDHLPPHHIALRAQRQLLSSAFEAVPWRSALRTQTAFRRLSCRERLSHGSAHTKAAVFISF